MAIDLTRLFSSNALSPEQEHYYVVAKEFYRKFGERVPREVYPDSITDAEVIEAMQTCIRTGENNLNEILGVCVNNDVLY